MKVSIVIPTRERVSVLARVLAALASQVAGDDEVIVVDDGSALSPVSSRAVDHRPFGQRLQVLSLPTSQGAAAARNAGLRRARGEVVLFLGDDTVPADRLLALHRAVHCRYPEEHVGCLGLVTWDPALPPTSFMVWLEHGGGQNAYGEIAGMPWVDPSKYLYGANVSCKRSLLEQVGGFQAERFSAYGWEDRDLGIRLAARGCRLVYEPAARAFHHHAHTVSSWRRRQQLAGQSFVRLVRAHPQHAHISREALGWRYRLRMLFYRSPVGGCLRALARAAQRRWLLPTLYGKLSGWEFNSGVHKALRGLSS